MTFLEEALGLCHLGKCLVQVSKVEFTKRLEIFVNINGYIQLVSIDEYTNKKCALSRAVEFVVSFQGVFDNLFKKLSAMRIVCNVIC